MPQQVAEFRELLVIRIGQLVPRPASAGLAIMGGTMRSPLTAIVFAIELTHNLGAMLPLAVACAMAHATTVLLLRRSILTEKVARKGHHA